MANEEHLAILKRGVEVWNKWRSDNNWEVMPDLSDAELRGAILSRNKFGGINLYKADLRSAVLSKANLNGAYLTEADLTGAELSGANLYSANLSGANLYNANLSDANLEDADLSGANLMFANLEGANLSHANLYNANLNNASLKVGNLENADLTQAQALGANFYRATLTGACIQNWHIEPQPNLDDVICKYVYLKSSYSLDRKNWSERRPSDPNRNFAPDEFKVLFQKALETVDLFFRNGVDWKAFAYSFNQLVVQYGDDQLSICSIENQGDGTVIVKLAAAQSLDKAEVDHNFWKGFEKGQQLTANQYEARLVDKDQHINQLFTLLQSSQERLGEVPKLMAEQRSGDINYYGDIKATNFAHGGIASGGTFNDFSNTQDLAQAAAQIQALLAQLQQQGQSPQDAQQQVANDLAKQADQDPALLGKLVKWGQKLGDATVTDVVKGVVKMALRSAGVPLP